jgi:hypothetical protein
MILIYIIHNIKKIRGDVMKKSICIVMLIAGILFVGCHVDDDYTGFDVKLEVIGTCPIVSIKTSRIPDYIDYYDLLTSSYVSEVMGGLVVGKSRTYYIDVYKQTGDATTVTATIYVDGVQVATQTTTAAYGHIRVEYTLQN